MLSLTGAASTKTVKPSLVAIGEILWDLFPSGKQLGGAPANFVYHAQALGADARVVTCVGDDPLGHEILARFRLLGLPTDTIRIVSGVPTGTVTVDLAADGTPSYTVHENVAWDHLAADAPAHAVVAAADAVCFGTLAQRTERARQAIGSLVGSAGKALRVLDINLRPPFVDPDVVERSLRLANVLKLNDHELLVLAEWFSLRGPPQDQLAELARRYNLGAIALTRGARGSLLWKDGTWSDHPGVPVQVADTVGAGDAFTAAWTIGLLAGSDLDEINRQANRLAAAVCSQHGGMPASPAFGPKSQAT